MATNKLMEAAADILTQSKKSAPSEPMHKMSTQVVDVGGPTPENYKNDDDSAKLDTTKAVDNSAASKNAASIKMKASAASAKMEETESEEEVIAEKSHDMEEKKEMMKKKMKEDVNALFSDDSTISEEFKSKAATIFEARVTDRIQQIEEEVEVRYASMFEEAVEEIKNDLKNFSPQLGTH